MRDVDDAVVARMDAVLAATRQLRRANKRLETAMADVDRARHELAAALDAARPDYLEAP